MATPGNTNTTTEIEVLRQIKEELIDVDGLSEANVFVVAESVFIPGSYPGDQYVQIVLGAASDTQAGAGLGLVEDEVRIVTYKRMLTDRLSEDLERLANVTNGLLELVRKIEVKMTQSFLGGRLLIPMIPVRREPGAQVPIVGGGWATVDRIYRMGYIKDFSLPQSLEV